MLVHPDKCSQYNPHPYTCVYTPLFCRYISAVYSIYYDSESKRIEHKIHKTKFGMIYSYRFLTYNFWLILKCFTFCSCNTWWGRFRAFYVRSFWTQKIKITLSWIYCRDVVTKEGAPSFLKFSTSDIFYIPSFFFLFWLPNPFIKNISYFSGMYAKSSKEDKLKLISGCC